MLVKNKRILIIDAFVIMTIIITYVFFIYRINSDMPSHAKFIIKFHENTSQIPANFLYYLFIYIFSFFSLSLERLLIASVFVLSVFTYLKYFIVRFLLFDCFKNIDKYRLKDVFVSLVSFILLYSFSIPFFYFVKDYYYLGYFPMNVWHNSTTILAMPFVLLLFWYSIKHVDNFNKKHLVLFTILIVLNALAKPSYLFVYVIVFPFFSLKRNNISKKFFLSLIPLVTAVLMILLEYVLIFKFSSDSSKNSVTISLFQFYNKWFCYYNLIKNTGLFAVAIVSSFLFPIVFLFRNRKLCSDIYVQFSAISVVIALFISQTIAEIGTRQGHGNFIWQVMMCSFLLYFVCVKKLIELVIKENWKKHIIDILFFLLHFLSGILYFTHALVNNTCY